MTLGEKIYRLRTQRGMSQEAFGEMLGISRQSVSKWETDQSVPELDKIVAISNMFGVSTDYLLKEQVERPKRYPESSDMWDMEKDMPDREEIFRQGSQIIIQRPSFHYEYKSKTVVAGLPLVHVNFGLRPMRAKGIFAIGNIAQGVVAIGIFGLGLIAFAPVSVGLVLAIGCAAAGGIAFGSLAVGVIAGGALCVGVFSMGAVAVGQFSFGAVALGKQVAIGDVARGNIALGFSEAYGSIYEEVRAADGSFDCQAILDAIDANVAGYWGIFARWMKIIIRSMVQA